MRLIIPWAAGGSTDSIGRILGPKLVEYTGQQWLIDNRAGATGTIGHAVAAKTPPDGYTLLLGTNSTFAIAPHLYKNLAYDNEKSFAPITLVAISPQILSVHPSLPVKNVKQLIALAKAQPASIPFSTAGVGATSHMATELLMNMAGIKMNHVPYKGGGPSAQALIARRDGALVRRRDHRAAAGAGRAAAADRDEHGETHDAHARVADDRRIGPAGLRVDHLVRDVRAGGDVERRRRPREPRARESARHGGREAKSSARRASIPSAARPTSSSRIRNRKQRNGGR